MALHGDVRINGAPLIRWSARRLTEVEPWSVEAEHEYDVEVVYVEDGEHAHTRLWHRYSDGAAALTEKVMRFGALARENSQVRA